jgi:hypothetical protein
MALRSPSGSGHPNQACVDWVLGDMRGGEGWRVLLAVSAAGAVGSARRFSMQRGVVRYVMRVWRGLGRLAVCWGQVGGVG